MGRSNHKLSKHIYFLGILKKKIKLDKNYNSNVKKAISFAIVELEKHKSLKEENSRDYMKKVYNKLKDESSKNN